MKYLGLKSAGSDGHALPRGHERRSCFLSHESGWTVLRCSKAEHTATRGGVLVAAGSILAPEIQATVSQQLVYQYAQRSVDWGLLSQENYKEERADTNQTAQ